MRWRCRGASGGRDGGSSTTDEMVWFAVEHAVGGYIAVGDTVVVIAGAPDRLGGAAADVMRIVRAQ